MVMKKIYKNLYYDTVGGKYWFMDEKNRKEVADEGTYLLIYILEVLLNERKTKV